MVEKTLPEHDRARPNTEQGLYRKFEVYRTDRSDAGPDCKHWNCDYFVIDVTHDRFARAALAAYADACEATHPLLAADMRARYGLSTDGVAGRKPHDLRGALAEVATIAEHFIKFHGEDQAGQKESVQRAFAILTDGVLVLGEAQGEQT